MLGILESFEKLSRYARELKRRYEKAVENGNEVEVRRILGEQIMLLMDLEHIKPVFKSYCSVMDKRLFRIEKQKQRQKIAH